MVRTWGQDLGLDVSVGTHTLPTGPMAAVVVVDAAHFAAAVGRAVQLPDDPDEVIHAVCRTRSLPQWDSRLFCY